MIDAETSPLLFFDGPDVEVAFDWLFPAAAPNTKTHKKPKTTQCVRWKLKELETRGCGETT